MNATTRRTGSKATPSNDTGLPRLVEKPQPAPAGARRGTTAKAGA